MKNLNKVIKTFEENKHEPIYCENCAAAVLMIEMGVDYILGEGCYNPFGEFIEKFGYEKNSGCRESAFIAYTIAKSLLKRTNKI